ncbi:CYTH and CHAD domain-containing protein [Alcaligenes sp. SDU_A2]|uniref:CYTH and CHAD domain-containing protein n=1 Tax=Alcaligenes sp. SDU_A2 TaxID=3136634 RepID=UPI00311DA658
MSTLAVLEQELKFFVPENARPGLLNAFDAVRTGRISLNAIYFDTPERELALNDIALRLRKENTQWVQTVKLPGPDTLSRIEINHPRPGPELDLDLYKGTDAEAALLPHAGRIQARYQTNIMRELALVQHAGSELELAYDVGYIESQGLRLPVNELEVELLQGDCPAMFEVGQRWLYKHGLLLELRSKSERGDALAGLAERRLARAASEVLQPEQVAAALTRKAYQLAKPHFVDTRDLEQFYRRSASMSLEQVIRNAALLAGVDGIRPSPILQADYLAMMRVGLRRLRSCRKLFKLWLNAGEGYANTRLTHYFDLFGKARDHDMVQLEITPLLLQAGMPGPAPQIEPAHVEHDPVELAAAAEFQSLLLSNLQSLVCGPALDLHGVDNPEHLIEERITRWFNTIQLRSQRFAQISQEKQHRLRNRIKSLRYCLEFLQSADDEGLHKVLRECQALIGAVTDVDVALQWYGQHAVSPEQAQFARAWLTQARQTRAAQAQRALNALGQHRPEQRLARH